MSRLLVCHHLIKEIILTRRIVLMPERTRAPAFIDGLYGKLVEGGINYFFPSANLQAIETGLEPAACGMTNSSDQTSLDLCWLGSRYSLTRNEPFSTEELKLLKGIGAVLDSRYRTIADTDRVEKRFELFRGLPEDRYVSACIDGDPYAQEIWQGPDRVEDTIEVLRTSSLSTYENRRISTGALLFGKYPDPCHEPPVTPVGALRYSPAVTSIRSFYRLCGGLLVVLDDPEMAASLVSRTDLLTSLPNHGQHAVAGAKDQFHYLLHQKRIMDVPSAVLETVARIDGGIVLDSQSNLLAFGAILRHPL